MFKLTKNAEIAANMMVSLTKERRNEFITPEHLLYGISFTPNFTLLANAKCVDKEKFVHDVLECINEMEQVPEDQSHEDVMEFSLQLSQVFRIANEQATNSGKSKVDVIHLFYAVMQLAHSQANYIICKHFGSDQTILLTILNDINEYLLNSGHTEPDDNAADAGGEETLSGEMVESAWRKAVRSVNAEVIQQGRIVIGRDKELERTIQILGRKENNNVLFIGEPGVGKTAMIQGLAIRINAAEVPADLIDTTIYSVDMSSIIAGAQMRGEFEKRFKEILDGAVSDGNSIIFLDEMHSLAGAGQSGEGAMDALNMLRPYLEMNNVRVIGATTYSDYNRYLAKNKGIMRRFHQVEIAEPGIEETMEIIKGLLPGYEAFHGVRYKPEAVRHAIEKSASLIADRFLPEKAIDIIDEAGSCRKRNLLMGKTGKPKAARYQYVDVPLVNDVLSTVCKINAKALAEEDNASLHNLSDRISQQIYGQDEAVRSVVQSVQMAKAGLLEPEKPLASLLFVGPTGVGKTEVCKVLAKELGIELVRFDMSEYTEKHTVAKLIGSPAGYIGYEDGGLLTDAIRKTPNCVLLLDEIEKAHSDIYNILLQVMDYAKLTDSRGNKADFKNVILIMTSNAGAQYASQGTLGFSSTATRGDAMMQTVRKTFKPEFLNRLSGTVVFHEMDMTMAEMILDKKLRQLDERLRAKGVTLDVTPEAKSLLLKKGYTRQYGAREMDRVLHNTLNPLLMNEILFGSLRKGGTAVISVDSSDQLYIKK